MTAGVTVDTTKNGTTALSNRRPRHLALFGSCPVTRVRSQVIAADTTSTGPARNETATNDPGRLAAPTLAKSLGLAPNGGISIAAGTRPSSEPPIPSSVGRFPGPPRLRRAAPVSAMAAPTSNAMPYAIGTRVTADETDDG